MAEALAGAHELRPDAKLDILDVTIGAVAAVRCRCLASPTFLVALDRPGRCPACRTEYVFRRLQVRLPPGPSAPPIEIQIGPKDPSPIMAPGGPLDGRRN